MPKSKKTKTVAPRAEILTPSPVEVSALSKSTQPTWIAVAYNLAACIREVGNAMGGVRPEADHVFGRCMGERSDGKTFFSTVILPWVQAEDYDWKPVARRRLDSFLLPECSCDARYDETKVCPFHLELIQEWEKGDSVARYLRPELLLPPAKEGSGIFPDTKEMHKLYPWCREAKDGRYICMICGYGKEQGAAIGNPTYRNIFIRDHSHCGFGGRYGDMKPASFLPDPITPPTPLPALSVKVDAEFTCKHCHKPIYQLGGVWFHEDLYRACHWSGWPGSGKVAEAA